MSTKCSYCGEPCSGKLQIAVYERKEPEKFCKECFQFLFRKSNKEIKRLMEKYNQ